MIRTITALIFLTVLSPAALFAQEYSISGTVTDENGNPVAGAEVILVDPSSATEENKGTYAASALESTKTGKDGRYLLEEIEPGTYTISVFSIGKKIHNSRVVVASADVTVNVELDILEASLDEVTVDERRESTFGITRLQSVQGTAIYDAKKSEVVMIDDIIANTAVNNSRQVYAKVAGLNIWETDGAGVQLAIGGRGLSPSRSSNFNTRQNGYDISADALGYPESYYTPPVQALKRIEIIRGAASLQYGTQFGGMLNFVFKDGPQNNPFQFNSSQSVGSFGLLTSFNSFGGTVGDVNYYGFYQYKQSDGWRPNSDLDQHTAYISFDYNLTPDLTITPEYTFNYYLAQQPGGLTDAQFEQDPRQSNRERNWFTVDWNLFALSADYRLSSATRVNTRFFGLIAGRDALGNLGRIDRLDFGGNRDLIKDDFRNWGNETRLIHRYSLLDGISVFLVGTRYYDGFDHQRQGEGSAGSDADFDFNNPDNLESSDFDLPSQNFSMFVENIFNLSPKFSITPGVRFEYIKTEADGYFRNTVRDLAGNIILDERIEEQRERSRSFVFFGIGGSFKHSPGLEVYANFSQNYRAINFNDIRVNVGSLEVDPDIDDERGFNIELGSRGTVSGLLNYDVSLFHLSYNDRIGTVLKREPNPQFNNLVDRTFRFRTNIADADIYGLESFAEVDLYKLLVERNSSVRLSVFTNLALITSEYAESDEAGIEGNEVELVPPVNFKTGVTFAKNRFEASYQFSYVGQQYSDASNARQTPTAIEGIIPSYQIMDVALKYSFNRYTFETGVNNLADEAYFTRRASGYPGPGIIPSQGRSFYVTVGLNF